VLVETRTPSQGEPAHLDLAQQAPRFPNDSPRGVKMEISPAGGKSPSPSGGSMEGKRVALKRSWIAALLLISVVGCQTARSWEDGCPGVYSGVRYFASQRNSLPWDGRVFFGFDLPLTIVADTLLLPGSFWVEPTRPQRGWVPGCRWAN